MGEMAGLNEFKLPHNLILIKNRQKNGLFYQEMFDEFQNWCVQRIGKSPAALIPVKTGIQVRVLFGWIPATNCGDDARCSFSVSRILNWF